MIRTIIDILCLLTKLSSTRLIAVFGTIAVENLDECARNSWMDSRIRLAGILAAVTSVVGRCVYA